MTEKSSRISSISKYLNVSSRASFRFRAGCTLSVLCITRAEKARFLPIFLTVLSYLYRNYVQLTSQTISGAYCVPKPLRARFPEPETTQESAAVFREDPA